MTATSKRTPMIDHHTATAEDLRSAGWPLWSADSGLYLCPLDQFAAVPDGLAMWSIGGAVAVKGRDYIDDDTRGGVLAYGIIPGKTRTTVTADDVEQQRQAKIAAFVADMSEMARTTGAIDMRSGRMLYGDEAEACVRSIARDGGAKVTR